MPGKGSPAAGSARKQPETCVSSFRIVKMCQKWRQNLRFLGPED
jgi:hypothetical protein